MPTGLYTGRFLRPAPLIFSLPGEAGGKGHPFAWEVRFSRVTKSGPLDRLPGCERTFVLLKGGGLDLTVPGGWPGRSRKKILDQIGEPFSFSGEAKSRCELLQGPVQLLDVIVRRDGGLTTVRRVRPTDDPDIYVLEGDFHLFYCLRGGLNSAIGSSGEVFRLQPGQILLLEGLHRGDAVDTLSIHSAVVDSLAIGANFYLMNRS